MTSPIRRRHNDPALDADVRRWFDDDPASPRVAILGPVTVEAPGRVPSERVRFYAEIITYLAARGERGATTDQFDEALWPGQQVKPASRRVDVSRARRWLGQTADGEPWLPDATSDRRYRLREGYLLDWDLFRRLRSRGESRGPAGTGDLRQALALVRGAPLAGADVAYSAVARNPYTWLPTFDIEPRHLTSGMVDTVYRLVELCLDAGDIAGARWAVEQAWLADPDRTSDITWRDLLRVAAAEGNTAELDQILDQRKVEVRFTGDHGGGTGRRRAGTRPLAPRRLRRPVRPTRIRSERPNPARGAAHPKVRNIGANPRVSVHLELDRGAERDGGVVTVEGVARIDPRPLSADETAAYLAKYADTPRAAGLSAADFLASYSTVIRIEPTRTRVY
ncbi:hypothetical protein AB0J86_05500 [Micromonospora sp. NPDC049559]|uniref:hypothetical protein n=1 Tax=Micromonospora sp. NPDC049559 TaxID=3155923 RepID=UPI00343930A3